MRSAQSATGSGVGDGIPAWSAVGEEAPGAAAGAERVLADGGRVRGWPGHKGAAARARHGNADYRRSVGCRGRVGGRCTGDLDAANDV